MAEEIAYVAKELDGIAVTLKRIADDIPMEVVSKDPSWSKIVEDLNNRIPTTPIADMMHELPRHHAIIFDSPTRFGNMAAPMNALWDMTSDL
jgi:NAD(P)H dehydrogenase (quinone)